MTVQNFIKLYGLFLRKLKFSLEGRKKNVTIALVEIFSDSQKLNGDHVKKIFEVSLCQKTKGWPFVIF